MNDVGITLKQFKAFVKEAKNNLDPQNHKVVSLDKKTRDRMNDLKLKNKKAKEVVNELFPQWKSLLIQTIDSSKYDELIDQVKKN